MNIRLVAADLDGTLLPTSQHITKRTCEAIRAAQEKGIEFVICTGRNPSECSQILAELPPIDYGLFCTGAFSQNLKTGEIFGRFPISADEGRRIYSILREYDCMITFFADARAHTDRKDMQNFLHFYPEVIRPLFENTHVIDESMDEFVENFTGSVDKFFIAFADTAERERALSRMKELPYYITGAGFCDFEIMNPNANKANALRALAAKLGLSQDRLCAVGDSANDVPMLKFAGLGVAMGNAAPEVKAEADLVAPTNDEDGVAWLLERLAEGAV